MCFFKKRTYRRRRIVGIYFATDRNGNAPPFRCGFKAGKLRRVSGVWTFETRTNVYATSAPLIQP